MPVAVVVVNYGSHALLAANLTLPAGGDRQVLVVDNESTTDERSRVTDLAAERRWQVLAGDGNPGFGAAVNVAARRARELGCDTMVLVNPDAVVNAEAVDTLAERVRRDPMLLTSPRVVTGGGDDWFTGSWLHLRDGRIRSRVPAPTPDWTPWLSGACLAISLELFERLGGFDDEFFLYWEDVDLSYRATLAGARLQVSDDVVVVHDEGGTHGPAVGGDRAKSPLYYRYNTRNRLLFAARHLDDRARLRWLVSTPAVSREILLRGGRRQLLRSPQPLWAAVRGSGAGVVLVLRALWSGRRAARDRRVVQQ